MTRVEALLRWEHPTFGAIQPRELLQVAADHGLLSAVTILTVERSLLQQATWRRSGLKLGISINLSPAELTNPETAGLIANTLRLHRSDPELLTVEIAAGDLLAPGVPDAIERLVAENIRVACDGATPSGLPTRSLVHLLDEIKISRALVAKAVADEDAALAVRQVWQFAHDFQLSIVGVGVEDRPTRELLAKLGCDEAQGYWMSRPLLAQEITPWRQWAAGFALAGAVASSGSSAGSLIQGQPAQWTNATGLVATLTNASAFKAEVLVESTLEAADLRQVANALDEAVTHAESQYGRAFERKPAVYVFATRSSFALGLQQGFGYQGPTAGMLAAANGGVTLSRENVIVINWANVSGDPEKIFRHEVTHALVHEILGPGAVIPSWFDEGLAALAETDGVVAHNAARERNSVLSLLSTWTGSLDQLSTPLDWTLRNAELNGAGYRIAAQAASLIREQLGTDGLIRVLNETRRTGDFAAAYHGEAGESLSTFTRSFPARLAMAHAQPRASVSHVDRGIEYTLQGFAPGSVIEVRIEGAQYELEFSATADADGFFEALFGSTSPVGDYRLTATGSFGTVATEFTVVR